MEAFILLIVVGVLLFFTKSIRNHRNHTHRLNPKVTSYRSPRQKRQSFDNLNANVYSEGAVLCGSAYIIDGDTLIIKNTNIRLFGIDAPELDHPFGEKAKWALFSLCKGQMVRADIIERDDYGRTVAKCYLEDNRDLSAEMVKLGLAIDWPKYSNGEYQDLELPDVRKKLWLADARQKGRFYVWEKFEAKQKNQVSSSKLD